MFKKKTVRNLRRKQSSSDEEGPRQQADSTTADGYVLDTDSRAVESASGSISKAKLLSFDNEEGDTEVFQVRKDRNLKKHRKKKMLDEVSAAVSSNDHVPSGPSAYDSRKHPVAVQEADSTVVNMVSDVEEEFPKSDEVGRVRNLLNSGEIPDAHVIHMARKRRELARTMGTVPNSADFVPIENVKQLKVQRSRLIREDDNDASDLDDDGGRFFSSKYNENEEHRRATEAAFLDVEQGDVEDEKEISEFEQWEREQLRKAVTSHQLTSYQQEQLMELGYSHTTARSMLSSHKAGSDFYRTQIHDIKDPAPMELDVEMMMFDATGEIEKFRVPTLPKLGGGTAHVSQQQVCLESVVERLKEQLSEKQSNYRARQLQRDKVQDQMIENHTVITELEETLPLLQREYEFYQEVRSYVRDLLDCLSEKISKINELEEEMVTLLSCRAEVLSKRRRQDVEDQYDECQAIAAGRKMLIQQDPDRTLRIAEREARRTRRRQAREKTPASIAHQEGMSSDDEEAPSRIAHFTSERERILAQRDQVFADTIEEFATVGGVASRFAQWSDFKPLTFQQAYIALYLPKILSPFIRLQLISWNPFETIVPGPPLTLEVMQWYRDLLTFGADGEQTDLDVSVMDEDLVNLIPKNIEKILCPKLTELIEKVWDPMSASQTKNLVVLFKEFVHSYPSLTDSSKQTQDLLQGIVLKARKSVNNDAFMPIFTKAAMENKSTGAASLLDRQFWSCFKLLQNMLSLEGVLSDASVIELAVDGVLNRYLVLGLQCSNFCDSQTLSKIKTVVNAIPSTWFDNRTDDSTMRQFEPLCKVVIRMAEEIHAMTSKLGKNEARDSIKELYKVLLRLHADGYAKKILQLYKIK